MKICSTCKIEKPFDGFSKCSRRVDGLQNICKLCAKKYRETDKAKETLKKSLKKYRESEKGKQKSEEYKNSEKGKEASKKALQKYQKSEKGKESKKRYSNSEKGKAVKKRCAEKLRKSKHGKIAQSIRAKRHRNKHKDKYTALAAMYRAIKIQATPTWLTEEHREEMQDFYTACKMFQIYTGLTYHVDHIVPLKGKDVCGLHVPWNLQILEAFENLSKSNILLEGYLYE